MNKEERLDNERARNAQRKVDAIIRRSDPMQSLLYRLDNIQKKLDGPQGRGEGDRRARLLAERDAVRAGMQRVFDEQQQRKAREIDVLNRVFPDKNEVQSSVRNATPEILKNIDQSIPVDGGVLGLINGQAVWIKPDSIFSATSIKHPFRVYIEDGYIKAGEGNHYWWNQSTSSIQISTPSLTPVLIGSNQTIYIKRVRDQATDVATVDLLSSTSSSSTIMSAADGLPEEKRWIVATVSSSGVVFQCLHDYIYEYRVS